MPIILKDDNGLPIPQYKNATSGNFEAANGSSGAVDSNIKTWPDGTDSTGVVQLTGGTGIRGWLSGIFSKLSGILTANINSLPAAMVAADGTLKATIAGRTVEEIVLFNALAITDTAYHNSPQIDVSKYQSLSFLVYNTLNQPITLELQVGGTLVSWGSRNVFNGTSFVAKTLTIPVSVAKFHIMQSDFGIPAGTMPPKIMVATSCATAPTSGSLTMVCWGVPN